MDGQENAARAQLARARAVYRAIFAALNASVEKLEAGEDTGQEARFRQDLYRAHVKQLQAVFEIERSLEDMAQPSVAAGRIDLAAARNEIRERLARARERLGSGAVSGGDE